MCDTGGFGGCCWCWTIWGSLLDQWACELYSGAVGPCSMPFCRAPEFFTGFEYALPIKVQSVLQLLCVYGGSCDGWIDAQVALGMNFVSCNNLVLRLNTWLKTTDKQRLPIWLNFRQVEKALPRQSLERIGCEQTGDELSTNSKWQAQRRKFEDFPLCEVFDNDVAHLYSRSGIATFRAANSSQEIIWAL